MFISLVADLSNIYSSAISSYMFVLVSNTHSSSTMKAQSLI